MTRTSVFERCAEIIGDEAAAELRDAAIKVYTAARDHAADHGIIIADTKFESGRVDGRLILADEVLTPDSSRFWPGDEYEPRQSQSSFLDSSTSAIGSPLIGTRSSGTKPPRLPEDVIKRTSEKVHRGLRERSRARSFPFGLCRQAGFGPCLKGPSAFEGVHEKEPLHVTT